MDCNLTYDEHITQVTSKCIGSLCQINRVKYLFDRRTLITIIDSLVLPNWGGTNFEHSLG